MIMKKILALALTLVMLFTIAACDNSSPTTTGTTSPGSTSPGGTIEQTPSGGGNTDTETDGPDDVVPEDGFELALITDLGTIDDRSFNQGAWEGLELYANEFGISHKYYMPAAQDDDAYLSAIELAVQSGAKVIVTPGYLFEVPIYNAQDIYPQVKFILLDGSPNDGDWESGFPNGKVSDNTVAVFYAEEQSGFLAGYAAVMDGYRNLGFMGGIAVPAVIRFGHGYIQGAEYAAQELGLEDDSISINYFYTGSFVPSPDIATRAAAWYNDGVEVIFACGGGICFSIFPAAEQSGNVVIGVDTDQSAESETVITSAMKLLTKSVYDCLADFYADDFPGGETLIFDAANLGVGLPMDTSKFDTFTQADYDAVFALLVDGTIKVDTDTEIAPDEIPTSAVVVNNLG